MASFWGSPQRSSERGDCPHSVIAFVSRAGRSLSIFAIKQCLHHAGFSGCTCEAGILFCVS